MTSTFKFILFAFSMEKLEIRSHINIFSKSSKRFLMTKAYDTINNFFTILLSL